MSYFSQWNKQTFHVYHSKVSIHIFCLNRHKILPTQKSLTEWYILHSLLSKLLTTVQIRHFKNPVIFFLHLLLNKEVAVHCQVGLGRTGSVAICWKSSDSQQARLRVGYVSVEQEKEKLRFLCSSRYSHYTCRKLAKRHIKFNSTHLHYCVSRWVNWMISTANYTKGHWLRPLIIYILWIFFCSHSNSPPQKW